MITVTVVLVLSLNLCCGRDCTGDNCNNTVDIPLIDKLNAPLKAELDISKLNKQLKELISQEVKQSVVNAVNELVNNSVENILKTAEERLKTENNNTLTAMIRGNSILKFFFRIRLQNCLNFLFADRLSVFYGLYML